MNRDKVIKIAILFGFVLVVIFIVNIIISIINMENKTGNVVDKIVNKRIDVAEECTFNVSLRDFNRLANNVSALKLCGGYNKITMNDITLNEEKAELYAIYFNGPLEKINKNLGIYLNNKLISTGASFDDRNVIRIYDNMLFIKKESIDNTNIFVYNAKGKLKYDFAYSLDKIILEDPAFKESNLKETRVTIDKVNVNSYLFDEGEFIFETTSDCKSTQEYKGSKYRVTYKNEKFKKPEFIEKIGC